LALSGDDRPNQQRQPDCSTATQHLEQVRLQQRHGLELKRVFIDVSNSLLQAKAVASKIDNQVCASNSTFILFRSTANAKILNAAAMTANTAPLMTREALQALMQRLVKHFAPEASM
jgi:hypothetical protein